MKWKSKGHEFDGAYDCIKNKKGFYLFGAGQDGRTVYDIIQRKYGDGLNLLGFIDNDSRKKGTVYCGLKVYSIDEIDFSDKTAGIIVTIAASVTKELEDQLKHYGLVKGEDYFHYYVFLSVWAAYRYQEVFLPNISFLPCTKCNLRCEACLNFTPHMKQMKERPWAEVKNDIDLFFSVVDYIGLFHISGGEPLMYTYIGELITYISENYGDKIFSLETVTNGTVKPSKSFLKALKEHNVLLTVDDYREALPEYAPVFEETVKELSEVCGKEKYVIRKYDEWIDLLGGSTEKRELTEAQLIEKYNSCHVPWQEYKNGKLFTCNYAEYAAVAEIFDEPEANEYFDFNQYDESKMKELVEFRMGYSDKGYAKFCERCAGYIEINPYKVIPAKQIERR